MTYCEIGFMALLSIVALCAVGIVILSTLHHPPPTAKRGRNKRNKRAK